ncbi:hypothetical protein IGI04_037238 [Brassica rapa subsp. trilocularis]|uniref:Homeobox domain-containing protein n=1 Tax=Brassica rapa subsp. trilocularis TaxID=1813537 RepID=A0ABQ7LJP7_BRACM|nr:hypothetical protein IGI04_037238 [Brassica rapa subsp. trilocularis]
MFTFANASQVKRSAQVRFLQQYSYGLRPQPSSKIVELAERIAALSLEERKQICHALSMRESKTRGWFRKPEEKKDKHVFSVKLEKLQLQRSSYK